MTKLEIFKEVVSILQNDSSTMKDTKGADPEPFARQISEEMSEEDFLFLMNNYLASFGVWCHIVFYNPKTAKPRGFRLRYAQGKLYVIDANPETNFQVGDVILDLDGVSLADFYEAHKDYFVCQTPERQYMDWARFISRTKTVRVSRAGEELIVAYRQAELKAEKPFSWCQLDEDTVYMKMGNFSNEAEIAKLYEETSSAISQSKNLIIDVRDNDGGSDSLYWPLFNYSLGQGQTMKDIPDSGVRQEFLYTERNVDLRLKQFAKEMEDPAISQESKNLIAGFSEELKKYRGQGYVLPDDSDDEHDYYADFVGKAAPEKIVVLADTYCGSSGDNFVATMKDMPKVTVMGRPTMGVLDYSNCCTAQFDDYVLIFPTSRLLTIDEGKGQTDKGIEPDRYISWTPEHLERDVDLEEALRYLETPEG